MNYAKIDNSPKSRKARILGHLEVSPGGDFDNFLHESTEYFLGSAQFCYASRDDIELNNLRQVCDIHGLAAQMHNSEFFYPSGYFYGAGSVSPHTDDGKSLTVAVLVATRDLSEDLENIDEYCQLITRDQCLNIKPGDVFIFNGHRKHAWIANCRWVILFQDVIIKRDHCCTQKS
jgi:hypothetical protein